MVKNFKDLLSEVKEEDSIIVNNKHERVLIIDSLNLFFRNFAILNMVNHNGDHIGGLGGSLRSLGFLIKNLHPTSVYMVFDGVGSTISRKTLLPEYKSGRNIQRLTNWDTFNNIEEEQDAKINQISRLIQYLKLLPIKSTLIDKSEADDVIAVLSNKLVEKYNSNVFIISNDQDFTQLITDKIILYRPTEKEYYDPKTVLKKFGVLSKNFILYKTLMGDSSDKIQGIKGLGPKSLYKLFPELATQELTLNDIFDISTRKFKEHIIYSRIVQERNRIENNYKVMDLGNPMVNDDGIEFLEQLIEEEIPDLQSNLFFQLYDEDKLGSIIKNPEMWLNEVFSHLRYYKK